MLMEKGPGFASGLRDFGKNLNVANIGTGIIATVFGWTAGIIPIKAAMDGNLTMEQTTSWLFGIYFFGGLVGIILALYYKKPINGAWSIPGSLLVGGVLANFSINQAVGAYVVAGIIVLLLGLSGYIRKAMLWLPQPIVMGMIAGAMFRFGTGMVAQIQSGPTLALLAIGCWMIFTKVTKKIPGVLWALIIGTVYTVIMGFTDLSSIEVSLAKPMIFAPAFDLNAFFSIALPLAVLVIAAENTQAVGVLMVQKYDPPINAMTIVSGIGGIIAGLFGGTNANIAGPMTAICAGTEGGKHDGRYVGSVLNGLLFVLFGLFAGTAASFIQAIPSALVNVLVGLSMIGVLTGAFETAFSGKFRIGAFFALCVAASNITLFKIGAPFWALVIGAVVSLVLERDDFAALKKQQSNDESVKA